MTFVDWLALAFVLLFAVGGARKGLIVGGLSLVGVVGGLIAVYSIGYMKAYHGHHGEFADSGTIVAWALLACEIIHKGNSMIRNSGLKI